MIYHELCRVLDSRVDQGDLEDALRAIHQTVERILAHQSSIARIFSARELDQICQKVGRKCLPVVAIQAEKGIDTVVYIVTKLLRVGGHSRVLLDIMDSQPAERHVVLVCDLNNDGDVGEIKDLPIGSSPEIRHAPRSFAFLDKTRWLLEQLTALAPRRTYLLQHPSDVAVISAVQPELVGQLIFIHHADFSLTLGVHLPHAHHVDIHAKGFYRCRDEDQVGRGLLWELAVQDRGYRGDAPFFGRGGLTTCASGSTERFESLQYAESVGYAYDYFEAVPQILKTTGGYHFHIGGLSDRGIAKIQAGLDQFGVARERFTTIPYVPNLWDALIKLNIDVYLDSFPRGGGRATVEAMGAGIPVASHHNYRSQFLSTESEVNESAFRWRGLHELYAWLAALNAVDLSRQSKMTRAHYERLHTLERLRENITSLSLSTNLPPRPKFTQDLMQCFFDEHPAVMAELAAAATGAEYGAPIGRQSPGIVDSLVRGAGAGFLITLGRRIRRLGEIIRFRGIGEAFRRFGRFLLKRLTP